MELDQDEALTGTLQGLSESLTELTNPSTTLEAQSQARRILQGYGQPDPEEDSVKQAMREQSERTRALLRAARERIAARQFDTSQLWLAAAQGLGAPTRTGAFSESVSQMAGAMRPVRQQQQEFQTGQEDTLTEFDSAINAVDDKDLAVRLQLLLKNKDARTEMQKEALKMLGKRVGAGDRTQQALDRAYVPEHIQFIQGGAAEATKALDELRHAAAQLKSSDTLTGPVVGGLGTIPLVGKAAQDIINPDASDVQETVEYTVQQSLRPILGAQFTEREGERLISRVYNRRLEEGVNAARLDRLITMLDRALKSKQEMAEYFETHGTLFGYTGKTSWTIDDIWPMGTEDEIVEEEVDEPGPQNVDNPNPPTRPPAPRPLEDVRKRRGFRLLPFAEGGEVDTGETRIMMIEGKPVEVPAAMSDEEALEEYYREDPSLETTIAESVVGAGAGYGAGRAGAGMLLRAADAVPPRRIKPGEKRVLDVLEFNRDDPMDLAKRLRDLQRRRVPAMMLDVAGPEVRALGEASLLPRASETGPTIDELKTRQKDTRNRVSDQVNTALAPDAYIQLQNKLKNDRSIRGKSMYGPVYQQFPDVKSKVLNEVMGTKEGKSAVKKAIAAWKLQYGSKPFGKPDATGMARSYSLEFLDKVKQYYDDEVTATQAKARPHYATLVAKNRDRLRDELDALTGGDLSPYKAARGQWEADSKVMEALEFGHDKYLDVSPEEAANYVKDLDYTGRDVLRSGVAEAILRKLQGPYTDTNPAQKLVGSPDTMANLELIFEKPQHFEMFKAALEAERAMFDETRGTLNKGKARQGQYESPMSALKRTAKERLPTLGVFSPTYYILKMIRADKPLGEKEADQVLRILRTKDPAYIEKTLGAKYRQKQKRKTRGKWAGAATALAGAAAPWLNREGEGTVPDSARATDEDLADPTYEDMSPDEIREAKNVPGAYGKGGRVKGFIDKLRGVKPEAPPPDAYERLSALRKRLQDRNQDSVRLRTEHYRKFPDAKAREQRLNEERHAGNPKVVVGKFSRGGSI